MGFLLVGDDGAITVTEALEEAVAKDAIMDLGTTQFTRSTLEAIPELSETSFEAPVEIGKNTFEITAEYPDWSEVPESEMPDHVNRNGRAHGPNPNPNSNSNALLGDDEAEVSDASPVTKPLVHSLIVQALAQAVAKQYEKHHYHLLQPGQSRKNHGTASLLVRYHVVKFMYEDGALHVYTASHHAWYGPWGHRTNHYYIGGNDNTFKHWKKAATFVVNIKNKPAASAHAAAEAQRHDRDCLVKEAPVVRRACCVSKWNGFFGA